MTPSEYAAEEIALWEKALSEQRELEEVLDAARRHGRPRQVLELMPQVSALRTRADLLLADAVSIMCSYRDHNVAVAWVSSTQSQPLPRQE